MKKFFILSSILISASALFSSVALASEVSISPDTSRVHLGERIRVSVYLSPQSEDINAVEGHLNYKSSLLSVDSVSFGNSILSFWPEQPHEVSPGVLSFSGVAPGGYTGSSMGLLFSVVFKAHTEGSADLTLSDMLALLDDGKGTKSNVSTKNTSVTILADRSAMTESAASRNLSVESANTEDIEAPETFIPLIGRNPDMFEGKSFLVFATTDKKSGIDHYEVQESRLHITFDKSWVVATSPYLLSDQNLHSFVYVRAYDKAGNFRTEILSPLYPVYFYQSVAFWVIILVVIFLCVFLYKKKIKNKICSNTFNPNENAQRQ
jgi:Cohesin domain